MVQVKLSNKILSIRGRFGGVYFKKDGGAQHIQAMPRIVNYTRSTLQAGGIKGYSDIAGIWGLILVAAFSAIWFLFALLWLFFKPGKKPKKITGYNWYIHYGLTRPEGDAPPFWKPPPTPSDLPDYYAVVEGMRTYNLAEHLWPLYFCSGYYFRGKTYNGKPWYKDSDRTWYIWWKDPMWVISKFLGTEDPPTTYYSVAGTINDTYINPIQGIHARVWIGKVPE